MIHVTNKVLPCATTKKSKKFCHAYNDYDAIWLLRQPKGGLQSGQSVCVWRGVGRWDILTILFHWSCHLNWYLEKKEKEYGEILGLVGEGGRVWLEKVGVHVSYHTTPSSSSSFFCFLLVGLLVQKWYINLSTQDWSLGMYVKLRCPHHSTMSRLTTWHPFFYIHCSTAFVITLITSRFLNLQQIDSYTPMVPYINNSGPITLDSQ